MSSASGWSLVFLAAVTAGLVWRRLLAYLRYFQQEGYEALRFLRWTGGRPLTDLAVWISVAACFVVGSSPSLTVLLTGLAMIGLALVQPDPRRSGKIPLRMTWRARRVLAVSAALAALLWLGVVCTAWDARTALATTAVLLAGSPLVLIAANAILAPYERHAQASFEADAARRVKAIAPLIVGITGSYGKSSAKAMLAHILQFNGPTLAASGSINTLMGVTRHIREDLVFGHRYMIVEMGAFKAGSIRRLCQLTPPQAGLITAVGDMHLERFGSTDEIVRAKRELAEALPPGGLLVVNADSPGALRIARSGIDCRVLLYGETSSEDLETRVEQIAFSKEGTTFLLRTRTGVRPCFTPLLGRPIILNLAGVATVAEALGIDVDLIVSAMRTLRPVSNRLEVVDEGGLTWIRDAYNSNQFGFRAALEVASALPAGRRVLATPGVIELGAEQFPVNRALAGEASRACDTTLIVTGTNREAFEAGHRDAVKAGGRVGDLVALANRTAAFRWIREQVKPGDLVILENDLPDLYEHTDGLFWSH